MPPCNRFNGIGRLYGAKGLERLRASHVCVVGLGGVGSWVVEAVARSGVGALTLVDLDEVCVSNTNRQLCALQGTVGHPKAEVIKSRVLDINPDCAVTSVQHFVTRDNARQLLASGNIALSSLEDFAGSGRDLVTDLQQQTPVERSVFDFVVDGIDGVDDKASLLAACVDLKVPAITSGGAGGLTDPTALRTCDMVECENDRLMKKVRKKMRQQYGFPKGTPGNLASAQVGVQRRRLSFFSLSCFSSSSESCSPDARFCQLPCLSLNDMCDHFPLQRRSAQRRNKPLAMWGIPAVYSIENQRTARDNGQNGDGDEAASEEEFASFRACDVSFGTSASVTGAFGLALGGYVVNFLASGKSVTYASRETALLRPPQPPS